MSHNTTKHIYEGTFIFQDEPEIVCEAESCNDPAELWMDMHGCELMFACGQCFDSDKQEYKDTRLQCRKCRLWFNGFSEAVPRFGRIKRC